MEGRKACARCQREIDEWAKLCPYCNWDQTSGRAPAEADLAAPAVDYTPPAERNWRRVLLIGVGIVALLVGSFGMGAFIHGKDAPEDAPEPITDTTKTETTAAAPARSPQSVNLIPATEQMTEAPITSAPVADPAQAQPNEYDRHDATAVSSVEYSQLAQRAQAERQRQKSLVDPRTLSGPAYAQGAQTPQATIPRRRVAPLPSSSRTAARPLPPGATAPPPPPQDQAPPPQQEANNERPDGDSRVQIRTRPVALSQPVPSIRVRQRSVVSLVLMVGADGSVQDINVRQGIPGDMPRILQSVQRWRFKPATENGRPVAAPYTVDITFNGN